jgi:hypothetical protein
MLTILPFPATTIFILGEIEVRQMQNTPKFLPGNGAEVSNLDEIRIFMCSAQLFVF